MVDPRTQMQIIQQSKKKLKVAKVFRIIKMEEYNNGVWNCSQT